MWSSCRIPRGAHCSVGRARVSAAAMSSLKAEKGGWPQRRRSSRARAGKELVLLEEEAEEGAESELGSASVSMGGGDGVALAKRASRPTASW